MGPKQIFQWLTGTEPASQDMPVRPRCPDGVRILTVYESDAMLVPGSSFGYPCDPTTDAMCDAGWQAFVGAAPNVASLDADIMELQPSHVIIRDLWMPANQLTALANDHPNIQFIIVCQGKLAAMMTEAPSFEHPVRLDELIEIANTCTNVRIGIDSFEMKTILGRHIPLRMEWVPGMVPWFPKNFAKETIPQHEKQVVRVGMFCQLRPLQNPLSQALAVIDAHRDNTCPLELHVTTEEAGPVTLDNVRRLMIKANTADNLRLVEHGPLDMDQFEAVVASLDIGIHAPHTGGFSHIPPTFLKAGVPMVTGSCVAWSPPSWRAESDSVPGMAAALNTILTNTHLANTAMLRQGYDQLSRYLDNAFAQWVRLTR